MSKKLVLIDGHSILNRAYYGLPDLTNAQGLHTNAVYGFINIMFKILEEEKPDYITVAFDVHAPTFRHKMFEEYKGNRKSMDEELRQQVPLMKKMLTAMGVKIIELAGYEADDLLGTIANRAEKEGMNVSIISGDRDLLQLATDKVLIRIPKTKRTGTEIENYFASDVKEAYGVTPKEFIDVKALQGDSSDNFSGVPGIGEKTAKILVAEYGSIEKIHENAAIIKPPRASKNIVEYWEDAVLCKKLATILTDAPIEYNFEDAKIDSISDLYTQDAYLLCKELEFKNLLNRFDAKEESFNISELIEVVETIEKADKIFEEIKDKNIAFYLVKRENNSVGQFNQDSNGQLGLFDFSTDSKEDLFGLSLTYSKDKVYFIEVCNGITSDYLRNKIKETTANKLITRDVKSQVKLLEQTGVLNPAEDFEKYVAYRSKFVDASIASYLINPTIGEYPLDDIAKSFAGIMIPTQKEFFGKETIDDMFSSNKNKAIEYVAYESYIPFMANDNLIARLQNDNMLELFEKVEMPLAFVLASMEKEGIILDAQALKEYSSNLDEGILKLQKSIYEKAGEEFNINSPKQLGVILFEKLALPNAKKTKTGYSTSADILDGLKAQYPIVSEILEYRQLTKLKSTYADGLRNYIEEDNRVRTTFNQTVTATGRLSSTEPNLQNIPIRIELGKQIRKVFHAKEGYVFVDSDYSQIELRVLAHLSEDEKLIDAYKHGKDIHRSTASLVFGVPFDEVTSLQRRNAKAVNFGIVYGISSFGLSKDLGISRKDASEYIKNYFEQYPKIKKYLDSCIERAKEKKYALTMFNRRRPMVELESSNFMTRQFGERVAMNSPIQGTAADIIKIAMIRVHDRIFKEKLESRLLLQVHDELLIEAKESELEEVKKILKEEMQGAAQLSVDLEIDTQVGKNWYDAH
ncbi:DNA polymerase I [Lachnobacterium bovis]|uniref:DNA polymerase I n=1 Tax=Lachnobacterium bovis TaxID=140626 RepID=UPI0003B7533A|nr:DNA polymerase I [Lachnobacterium bovis]